jgi:hypothetical protein
MSEAIQKRNQPGAGRSALALAGWSGLTFAAAMVGGFFHAGQVLRRLPGELWTSCQRFRCPALSVMYWLYRLPTIRSNTRGKIPPP